MKQENPTKNKNSWDSIYKTEQIKKRYFVFVTKYLFY